MWSWLLLSLFFGQSAVPQAQHWSLQLSHSIGWRHSTGHPLPGLSGTQLGLGSGFPFLEAPAPSLLRAPSLQTHPGPHTGRADPGVLLRGYSPVLLSHGHTLNSWVTPPSVCPFIWM